MEPVSSEPHSVWTSLWDGADTALSRRVNYLPLGVVTGSSLRGSGLFNDWFRCMRSGHIEPLARIFTSARDSALDHLRAEAH